MPENAMPVNALAQTEQFLAGFSGNIFIRLIHGDYDDKTRLPAHLKPRQHYGDLAATMAFLNSVATVYNNGSTDNHKFNVYYCVNDPAQGKHTEKGSISELRAIYQDCDNTETALIEPEIDGQKAHAVLETSPGKRQRIFHTEPLPIFKATAIHDHMVAHCHHDASTHGQNRILRLPGFRNWKYDGGPYATLLASSDSPKLTYERVAKAFGFRHLEGNINAAAQALQRSGNLPSASTPQLDKERAKRSPVRDHDHEMQRRQQNAAGAGGTELSVSLLLDTLCLIDPDEHRNEWRRVLAALHFMAGDRAWGKELAEDWSAQGSSKYDAKSFEKHWRGLNADVANPAHWGTLLRITDRVQHDKRSRSLRQCEAFKRFEEMYGPAVEIEQFDVKYPFEVAFESSNGTGFRPDVHEIRNYKHLLMLHGVNIWRDDFAKIDVIEQNGKVEELIQDHLTQINATAQFTGLRTNPSLLANMVETIASDGRRDLVREFLGKLPIWDGIPRLSTAFQRHLGAPDSPSIRETLPLLMCAIVRRSYQPGYKFDLMPILEGKQGFGKSSFWRLLMPNGDWFGEGPKMNEEAKRLLSQLQGKLLIEFAELAGMSKADVGSVKKLITQQSDEFIANFARKKTKVPRRCVFVGTVNSRQYLRDLTDNRRFPVIPVLKELIQHLLIAEREQLWAEAVFEEAFIGDDLRLSEEAVADMERIQKSREEVSTETSAIRDELEQFETGWLTVDTIWNRLGFPHNERSKRIGHAQYLFKEVRELMERAGWKWNEQLWVDGKNQRVIYKKLDRITPPQILFSGTRLTTVDDLDLDELLK